MQPSLFSECPVLSVRRDLRAAYALRNPTEIFTSVAFRDWLDILNTDHESVFKKMFRGPIRKMLLASCTEVPTRSRSLTSSP